MAAVAEALLPGGVKGSNADDCKELGNKMLQANKVDDAIWFYSLGLEKRPGCHVLLSNRSAAYARMSEWKKALDDANECVKSQPDWIKGYGRKAAALEGLKRFEEAISVHERMLELEPNRESSQEAIESLRQRHAEAIKNASYEPFGEVKAQTEPASEPAKPEEEKKSSEVTAKSSRIETLKAKGNKAFSSGNFEDAVSFFTDAIELDKGNHVLFSNRSAAYSSVSQFQSALTDAQKCINLAPRWAKGYGRKAAALVGLNRRNEAILAYQEGLRYEPDNSMLLKGLAEITPSAKVEPGAGATQVKVEDQSNASSVKAKEEVKEEVKAEPLAEADLELLSEFLSETSDLERKQQVERILKYKLNPFEVLQVRVEMTVEEIKMGYRRVSLMVHPDKCKHPRAEEAFEVCKKALAELEDADKRKFYVEIMDAARQEAERELKKRKRQEREEAAARKKVRTADVNKLRSALFGGVKKRPRTEAEEDSFQDADADEFNQEEQDMLVDGTREAALRILTQLEKRRAHAEKVFIANEKRDKESLAKLKQETKVNENVQKDWDQARLNRIDSWREFSQSGKKSGIRKPKPHVTEKGVSVLPPTMGGLKKTKEEEELLGDFLDSV